MAVFLQYFSTFVSGFVIAFVFNWKLALVTATMLPILATMAAAIGKVHNGIRPPFRLIPSLPPSLPPSIQIISSFSVREQTAYASAGAIAEQAISSIRTVVAFGGEQKEAEQ